MRLLIRTDASHQIGGGHVMRCLTLARAAQERGHEIIFATRPLKGHMIELITENFSVSRLAPPAQYHQNATTSPHAHWLQTDWESDAKETKAILAALAPDWLILDHYALDQNWIAEVNAPKILVMDDLADRPLFADILLNQTSLASADKSPHFRRPLFGPNYALLRPEFSQTPINRGKSPPRILIAPGFMDSYDLSTLALDALANLNVEIDLATGPDAPALPQIRARNQANLTLHTPASNMGELIASADLAIAAGGMSAWERAALALPSIVISVADNQAHVCAGLHKAGAVTHLSGTPRPSAETLQAAVKDLLTSPQQREKMAKAARTLCDGRGADRVLDILEAQLRVLTPDDEQRLFDWRNQPHIRAASLTQGPLDRAAHSDWFANTITSKTTFARIYREGSRDLGFIVAKPKFDSWHWSFYIGEPNAPKGAGRRMLVSFLDQFFATTSATEIHATVLKTNPASLHLHGILGFTRTSPADTPEQSFKLNAQSWEASKTP